tara:strand:+ start:91 stop:567 length:477 start_codon:yes stop_codon:yes gene_type:complete
MVLGLFKSKKQRKEESNRKKLEASVKTGKKLGGRSGANIAKKAQAQLDAPAKAKALAEKKAKQEKAITKARTQSATRNQRRGSGIKNRSSSTSTSKSTTKTKTKKVGAIEKQNRANLGDKTVNRLKQKSADFKSYQKGTMTKAQFIKKYPNSNLAKGR